MTLNDSGIVGPRAFPSTSWSAVAELHTPSAERRQATLTRLATLYWKPIHCVIRYHWCRSSEDAKDLTQEFFATVLLTSDLVGSFTPGRGSFRSFLRGALTNFMNNVARDARRLKRGGGATMLSLDGDPLHLRDLDVDAVPPTPEALFEIAWDSFALREAVERLRAHLESTGRAAHFDLFRRYDLEAECEDRSYEDMAAEFGWTVRKVRRVLTETRADLRAALAGVIVPSVDGPAALRAEMRRLVDD